MLFVSLVKIQSSKLDLPIAKTLRQIQYYKDSLKFSFFCRTIKDWNILPEDTTNNTTTDAFKEGLSLEMLIKTLSNDNGLCLLCLMPLSTLYQMYCGGQYYLRMKPKSLRNFMT